MRGKGFGIRANKFRAMMQFVCFMLGMLVGALTGNIKALNKTGRR